MENEKIGNLILRMRKEKGFTQKQLADSISVSDKTVSKWERGLGCPDVSLLGELAKALGVSVDKILSGSLYPNDTNVGNLKRIKFYLCPVCGNIMTSVGESEISCCGRKLEALSAKPADKEHEISIETIEDDYYISFAHEMSKGHYISFMAYVRDDKLLFIKLYPEQGGEVRFARMHGGKIYYACNRHGLWVK